MAWLQDKKETVYDIIQAERETRLTGMPTHVHRKICLWFVCKFLLFIRKGYSLYTQLKKIQYHYATKNTQKQEVFVKNLNNISHCKNVKKELISHPEVNKR